MCVLDICRVFLYTDYTMKLKRAFQLKQLKITKLIFSLVYKKSVLKKEITESDLTKLRELVDEQDKLLDVE